MSRCFPYPPPGYEARERPELELLRREREKAKERKQRKKEKRERKEKSRDYGKLEEKKHSTEYRGKERQSKADRTRGDDKKRKLKEVEQVEKSNITEEHGQPASTHGQPASTQDFCGSSDRTQSSARRRQHDIGAYAGHNQGSTYKCNALESSNLRMEAQHGDLLDNWKPLELQMENPDFDYEDWLLEKKQQGEQGCKNCTVGDNSIFWTSCYFPATEMLALPYIVPY